jgi:hypothetical protein
LYILPTPYFHHRGRSNCTGNCIRGWTWCRIEKVYHETQISASFSMSNRFRSHSSSPSVLPTSLPTPSYMSKAGAFNGSSFALGTTTEPDQHGLVELYFQHHSGEIRWLSRSNFTNDDTWTGGQIAVATDARNSTPLSIWFQVSVRTVGLVLFGFTYHSDTSSGTYSMSTKRTTSAKSFVRQTATSGRKDLLAASSLR